MIVELCIWFVIEDVFKCFVIIELYMGFVISSYGNDGDMRVVFFLHLNQMLTI